MDAVVAYTFGPDGAAAAVPVPARAAELAVPGGGFGWVHVNASGEAGRGWLEGAGLEPLALAALQEVETRPRATAHGEAVLMSLRGVNLNPGAEPEDMVALRLFLTGGLVVTVERRELSAVDDVMAAFDRGPGPPGPGDLVARLALRLADRAEPVVSKLNERIDDLEDAVPEDGPLAALRGELADIRRMAILMRRYMFPQRDALSGLEIEEVAWLTRHDRARLREATERVTRLAEELDAIRDRAQVVHDMVMDLRSEAMNRQMLLLSVVSAIFLPLAFLTGLFGVNLGGIPGAHWGVAFGLFSVLLVVLGVGLVWLFRRLGFFGRG